MSFKDGLKGNPKHEELDNDGLLLNDVMIRMN